MVAPSDYSVNDDSGVPVVTVMPLQEVATRLGVDFGYARDLACRDHVLLDAWKWPEGSSWTFPPDHRYWVPEAWLTQKVEEERARTYPATPSAPLLGGE